MDKTCDLLIIGGGINGCGIAQEAQTRGLKVILCEKNDLAGGTSSASSKLIHGGLRYLEQNAFGLVQKALKERETLFKICPHLIQPLPFFLPYSKKMRPFWLLRLGLFIYDHLAKTTVPRTRSLVRHENGPFFSPLKPSFSKGFHYFDAIADDARLVITNALQAQIHGAEILTRTTFSKTTRFADHWVSCLTQQEKTYQIKSKALINAAGPWVENLNNRINITTPYSMSLIKGSHLIIPKLYEGDHAYILQNTDKRVIFTIPYQQNYTLVGTTDSSYQGALDDIQVTNEEKLYLCQSINEYFKRQINTEDVITSFSGLRPLVKDNSPTAKDISRDYILHLDKKAAPHISIFSGKLTTYRKLSLDTLSLLSPYFPTLKPSRSDKLLLPGSDISSLKHFIGRQQEQYPWLPTTLLQRYARQYGTRMDIFLKNCSSMPSLGQHFGADLYQKEVIYLKQHEWAQTSDDILKRRTKLSLKLNEKEINQLEKELSNLY